MIPGEFRLEFFEEFQECFADPDRENNSRRKKVKSPKNSSRITLGIPIRKTTSLHLYTLSIGI